jgi:hypothetical protein
VSRHDHPLYKTWIEMICRCEASWKHNYKYYGAKGIKVCERWHDFEAFTSDMGEKPKGYTLDRINRFGNYEPGNCRWADKLTQANNTSFNRILEVDSERLTLAQWSRKWKVPMKTIWRRLQLGWEVSDAVKRTVRKHKPYEQANERQKL